MTDLPTDKGVHPDGPMAERPGGGGRKWLGRFAWAGFQFVEIAVTGVLGMVVGLFLASWYAMSSVAGSRSASGAARDFAPDFEPELSTATTWVVALATGGLSGLLIGVVLGGVMVRAFAANRARKLETSGDS